MYSTAEVDELAEHTSAIVLVIHVSHERNDHSLRKELSSSYNILFEKEILWINKVKDMKWCGSTLNNV